MNCLLSIVIPIKGNYHCLRSIVDTFEESFTSGEVELIIQDNTEDNIELVNYLNNHKNKYIKYYHTARKITMSENFEEGIMKSEGKFVSIIGADDNVTSKIIDVVKYLEEMGYDSAIFNKGSYNWPGMSFRVHRNLPSLIIKRCSGKIEEVNVEKELHFLMTKGMVSLGKLPEPYHGIVSREKLLSVFNIAGTFVPGACPDMAMAIALSQISIKHVYIDAPFVISGHSYDSAGGKGARGEHKGDLKNKPFLPSDIEETWPEFIPKIWTGPTIYADSIYSALRGMGQINKFKEFNYFANYANIISFFPEYRKSVMNYIIKSPKNITILSYHYIKVVKLRLIAFIENYIMSNFNKSLNRIYFNIENSNEARKLVDEYIDKKFKHMF